MHLFRPEHGPTISILMWAIAVGLGLWTAVLVFSA